MPYLDTQIIQLYFFCRLFCDVFTPFCVIFPVYSPAFACHNIHRKYGYLFISMLEYFQGKYVLVTLNEVTIRCVSWLLRMKMIIR